MASYSSSLMTEFPPKKSTHIRTLQSCPDQVLMDAVGMLALPLNKVLSRLIRMNVNVRSLRVLTKMISKPNLP